MTQLDVNNKQEVIKFLNSKFSGMEVEELRELLERVLRRPGNPNQKQVIKLLSDSMEKVEFFRLSGDPINGSDVFLRLKEVFENLHYDNGLPLSGLNFPKQNPTEENDYFEDFDRTDEFWSYFDNFPIKEFKFDSKGNLVGILDLTYEDLFELCKDEYDGSSWEDDFGDRSKVTYQTKSKVKRKPEPFVSDDTPGVIRHYDSSGNPLDLEFPDPETWDKYRKQGKIKD